MRLDTLTARDRTLLDGIRSILRTADEALLCVAFAHPRGVHLIRDELHALSDRARIVATTTFDQTGGAALALAREAGARVRTLNPGGGTYHPKVYLTRTGRQLRAIVGSANLTGGLICNVEVGMLVRGSRSDPSLKRLDAWAEETWDSATDWTPELGEATGDDVFEPSLLVMLDAERRREPVFQTLGASPRANRVVELTPTDVFVETERSRERVGGAARIPAWMFNVAWDYLRTHGSLTNTVLLDHLRVHRSSAVCAILARLPGVSRAPGKGVALLYSARG